MLIITQKAKRDRTKVKAWFVPFIKDELPSSVLSTLKPPKMSAPIALPYLPTEIVINIFEQCKSSKTLKSMALTSRLWFDIYLSVSWRTVDDMRKILVALCRGSDFAYKPTKADWDYFTLTYAPRIRHLIIEPSSNITIAECDKLYTVLATYRDSSSDPIFPNLISMAIDQVYTKTARTELASTLLFVAYHLLSPTVTKFSFHEESDGFIRHDVCSVFLTNYIATAVEKMPRLTDVSFYFPSLEASLAAEFSSLFSSLPLTTTKLSLNGFICGSVVFNNIQHLQNLAYTCLVDCTTFPSPHRLVETFTALRSLGLALQASKAIEFTSVLSRSGLGIGIRGLLLIIALPDPSPSSKPTPIAPQLAKLFQGVVAAFPNLRSLDVRLDYRTVELNVTPRSTNELRKPFTLTVEHLACLSQLTDLKTFVLVIAQRALGKVSLDNQDIAKLVSQWPELTTLTIGRSLGGQEDGKLRPLSAPTAEKGTMKKFLDLRVLHVLARYCPKLKVVRLDGTCGMKRDGFIFGRPGVLPGYVKPNLRFLNFKRSDLGTTPLYLTIEDVLERGVIEDVDWDGQNLALCDGSDTEERLEDI
ncbi:hypothetical protein PQX77_008760 [Marasmius sp. AFHP31]|nr:hypothetical protein PQX77_008760 [Marasmius sp. AFHP31]